MRTEHRYSTGSISNRILIGIQSLFSPEAPVSQPDDVVLGLHPSPPKAHARGPPGPLWERAYLDSDAIFLGLYVPYQNMEHNPTEQGHTGPGRIGSGASVYALYS